MGWKGSWTAERVWSPKKVGGMVGHNDVAAPDASLSAAPPPQSTLNTSVCSGSCPCGQVIFFRGEYFFCSSTNDLFAAIVGAFLRFTAPASASASAPAPAPAQQLAPAKTPLSSSPGASAHSLTDFSPDGVCLPSEVLAPQELAIAVARVGSGESSTEDEDSTLAGCCFP